MSWHAYLSHKHTYRFYSRNIVLLFFYLYLFRLQKTKKNERKQFQFISQTLNTRTYSHMYTHTQFFPTPIHFRFKHTNTYKVMLYRKKSFLFFFGWWQTNSICHKLNCFCLPSPVDHRFYSVCRISFTAVEEQAEPASLDTSVHCTEMNFG